MRFLVVFLLLGSLRAMGGSIILDVNTNYIDASKAPYINLKPGDTLFLQAGSRPSLVLRNFKGTEARPFVIINYKGQVTIENSTLSYTISIQNCAHIKFSGGGIQNIPYGIKANALTGVALGIGYGSTDYEIERLELSSGVGPGILAKTDPDCSFQYTRGKFVSRRIRIHHNYVHHTATEGMYIGSTYYEGQRIRCNGVDTLLYPHMSDDVRVYANRTYKTGWDGIQVSSSTNAQVFNNRIEEDSQALTDYQMNGIILGKGFSGKCYNNFIKNGKGTGIISFAKGPVQIFNNIIKNPGSGNSSPASAYGMYIDAKYSAGASEKILILNNLIIAPKIEGIRYLGDPVSGKDTIANNIIVDELGVPVPSKIINVMSTEGRAVNNQIVNDFSTLPYCDPSADNFKICKTKKNQPPSIRFEETSDFPDFNGDNRMVGADIDLGPVEDQENVASGIAEEAEAAKLILFPNPAADQLHMTLDTQSAHDRYFTVTVCNLAGQQLLSFEFNADERGSAAEVDISRFSPGIYLLQARSDEHVYTQRFVKR